MNNSPSIRFLKYAVLTAAGLALLYATLRLGLNYSGFCHEQRRFMTNQERIEIVVRRILSSYPPTLKTYVTRPDGQRAIQWERPEKAIPYESVEEFFAVNPDCCEVTLQQHPKQGGTVPLLERLSGDTAANVRVRYQVRYLDENEQLKTEYVESYWAVSNCGRPH